jgi:hypothetical protein
MNRACSEKACHASIIETCAMAKLMSDTETRENHRLLKDKLEEMSRAVLENKHLDRGNCSLLTASHDEL